MSVIGHCALQETQYKFVFEIRYITIKLKLPQFNGNLPSHTYDPRKLKYPSHAALVQLICDLTPMAWVVILTDYILASRQIAQPVVQSIQTCVCFSVWMSLTRVPTFPSKLSGSKIQGSGGLCIQRQLRHFIAVGS